MFLKCNKSLLYLDLSWNGFNGKCLENLGKGLSRNCHLEELNLKYNRIDLKTIISFVDCLYTNKSLKKLCVSINGIHNLFHFIKLSLLIKSLFSYQSKNWLDGKISYDYKDLI